MKLKLLILLSGLGLLAGCCFENGQWVFKGNYPQSYCNYKCDRCESRNNYPSCGNKTCFDNIGQYCHTDCYSPPCPYDTETLRQ
jgi:hypothetical protein